jgi:glutathione S-transferase
LILLVRSGIWISTQEVTIFSFIDAQTNYEEHKRLRPHVGLVPAMKYSIPGVMDEQIIYESAVVSQFLCDSFPSHLLPSTQEDPQAPLKRARINFFVDTWNSKLSSQQMVVMKAPADEKEKLVDEWVALVKKEIEPLLADAAPFVEGSKELTYAEVIIAPFLVRLYAYSEAGQYVPASLAKKLDALPNFGKWAKAVRNHKSVLKIWDGPAFMEAFNRKYGKVFAKVE